MNDQTEKSFFIKIICIILIVSSQIIGIAQVSGRSMEPCIYDRSFVFYLQNDLKVPFTKLGLLDSILDNKSKNQFFTPTRGQIILASVQINGTNYKICKRVVGLPGDHIVVDKNQFTINGEKVEYLKAKNTKTLLMILPTGEEFFVMGTAMQRSREKPIEVRVREGEVFCLGDNIKDSVDSLTFGCIAVANIRGRVIYSLDKSKSHKVAEAIDQISH